MLLQARCLFISTVGYTLTNLTPQCYTIYQTSTLVLPMFKVCSVCAGPPDGVQPSLGLQPHRVHQWHEEGWTVCTGARDPSSIQQWGVCVVWAGVTSTHTPHRHHCLQWLSTHTHTLLYVCMLARTHTHTHTHTQTAHYYNDQLNSWLTFVDISKVKAFVELSIASSIRAGTQNLLAVSLWSCVCVGVWCRGGCIENSVHNYGNYCN